MLDSLSFLPEVTVNFISYGDGSICHEDNVSIFQLCKDSSKKLRDSKFDQFNMEQKLAEVALSSYHVCCHSHFECLRGGLRMLCVGQFFPMSIYLFVYLSIFLVFDFIFLILFFFKPC